MSDADEFSCLPSKPVKALDFLKGGTTSSSILKTPEHERDVIALIRTIGKRMTEAREMCGLTQLEAARRIGFANSSKLSKVEKLIEITNVPVWLLVRAAQVYDVSADFLLGLSDSESTDTAHWRQQRKVSEWLFDHWQAARERDLAAMAMMNARVDYAWRCTLAMQPAANEAVLALVAFMEANPEFEDMRGGARLVRTLSAIDSAVLANKNLIESFHFSLELEKRKDKSGS